MDGAEWSTRERSQAAVGIYHWTQDRLSDGVELAKNAGGSVRAWVERKIDGFLDLFESAADDPRNQSVASTGPVSPGGVGSQEDPGGPNSQTPARLATLARHSASIGTAGRQGSRGVPEPAKRRLRVRDGQRLVTSQRRADSRGRATRVQPALTIAS